jgi:hypothetical protein
MNLEQTIDHLEEKIGDITTNIREDIVYSGMSDEQCIIFLKDIATFCILLAKQIEFDMDEEADN